MKKRTIELLAPAKNIACGIEDIKHGADAVYIGAPKFGARSSAGNSIEDIRNLVAFAHQFNAKIYVTLNTILRDEEIEEAEELIRQLYYANVDALIVQDMAVLKMNIPPIAIHASTQTDNRTVEKVQFLASAGFSQVVLARELSLNEIRTIHENCKVALECFVHGALCVSYSGQCYISHAFTGRSANRGECAQFCRLPYNLIDADGKRIETQKHLLSLKDMNRSKYIEDLIEAGVSSFKIEGRLKDISYVKNVTAFYRKAIDAVLEKRSDCKRSSRGISEISFTPNIHKTFNREYTDYYLNERDKEVANYGTPKFKGEYIGSVVKCQQKEIRIKSDKRLANGDG
ncbi:MAG: peptidase U32 family protein, partial [Tannerellaceae bacterium]